MTVSTLSFIAKFPDLIGGRRGLVVFASAWRPGGPRFEYRRRLRIFEFSEFQHTQAAFRRIQKMTSYNLWSEVPTWFFQNDDGSVGSSGTRKIDCICVYYQ